MRLRIYHKFIFCFEDMQNAVCRNILIPIANHVHLQSGMREMIDVVQNRVHAVEFCLVANMFFQIIIALFAT